MSMTTNRREKAATTFCMMDIFLSISVQVFLCSLFAQQRAQNDNQWYCHDYYVHLYGDKGGVILRRYRQYRCWMLNYNTNSSLVCLDCLFFALLCVSDYFNRLNIPLVLSVSLLLCCHLRIVGEPRCDARLQAMTSSRGWDRVCETRRTWFSLYWRRELSASCIFASETPCRRFNAV